ncbi:MAG: 50S ribosomal protein L29 [Treponema sp.]|jgi:large subunit ribosomal protein L29|nr:50S ribosomal protein L29 [Treponema sp.]
MKNTFKNLSFPELKAKRDELNRKYMELRFQVVVGHVDNPLQKRIMRRQIARLNTLIRAQEISQAAAQIIAQAARTGAPQGAAKAQE